MTRAEVTTRYRPIRAAIQRLLREASAACGRADFHRAARQIAPWAEADQLQEAGTVEMLADIALFEPNQRGRRAFDRFLTDRAERLGAADRALAERLAGAWFSLFRVAGRHATAGLWLDDLLKEGQRLWLVDEAFERTAPEGAVFGMRLFDAGPFHAGFGIIVAPDGDTLDVCLAARERGARPPFRHSLAATLYGDQLRAEAPPGPADLALLQTLFELLTPDAAAPSGGAPRRAGRRPSPPRRSPRPRKA